MASEAEMEQFFREICRAVNDGALSFFQGHVDDHVLAVGSAPNEVYDGKVELLSGLRSYGAVTISVRAWLIDGVGCCFGDVNVAGVPARLSVIAHHAADGWQICHWHLSVGVPDDEAMPSVSK